MAETASSEATREVPVWPVDRVLALAPDAASARAARGIAGDEAWAEEGASRPGEAIPPTVWGLARGRAVKPYQTAVDLAGPAYHCSCPSGKVPCKHALGLLLRWAAGAIRPAPAPGWVRAWHATSEASPGAPGASRDSASRRSRAPRSAPPAGGGGRVVTERAKARRAERVAAGLDELDRWLTDQVHAGIAGLASGGYSGWDAVAARLVDAQAPAVARVIRGLAAVAGDPARLLSELALVRLLIEGFRGVETLPEALAETVLMRIGFPMPTGEVLARQPRIPGRWRVVGVREEYEDQLTVRREWLKEERGGEPALVLSFAGPGQPLPPGLTLGELLVGELCFYPGALPLRGLIAGRDGPPEPSDGAPPGETIAAALTGYARALAADPWLDRWPVVLAAVLPVSEGGRWFLAQRDGDALPIDPAAGEPWRLVGAVAGAEATVAGEWSVNGLRPLAAWPGGRLVRL